LVNKQEERIQEKLEKAADLFTSKDNIELPRNVGDVEAVSAFLEKVKRTLVNNEQQIDQKTGEVDKLTAENKKLKQAVEGSIMFMQSLVNDLSVASGSATQTIRAILPLIQPPPQQQEKKNG